MRLQTEAWHGCLLRLYQHLTETDADTYSQPLDRAPGSVRGKTKGAEGDCNIIGRTAISTNQTPSELPGTKSPTKEHTWAGPWPPNIAIMNVVEDYLVWPQWERMYLMLWKPEAPGKEDAGWVRQWWVGGWGIPSQKQRGGGWGEVLGEVGQGTEHHLGFK